MMALVILLVVAAIMLVALIDAEKTEQPRRILAVKTPLSLLFIVAWALPAHTHPPFSRLILIGLALCLIGDVLLAFASPKVFLLGLIAFLSAHGVYAAQFLLAVSSAGLPA